MFFNKKCVFGGVCLVNTVVIAISNLNVVVAKGIHDFRSELNQIAWDINCSQREYEIKRDRDYRKKKSESDNHWILEGALEESRRKVVGKAIGECVAGKNQFKGKSIDDIITLTFQDDLTSKIIEPKDYEQKHFSPIILYNYIHEVINGNRTNHEGELADVNAVLKDKLDMIKANYGNTEASNKRLDIAVEIVKRYVKALKLNEYLLQFKECKQKYDGNQSVAYLAPNISPKIDESKKALTIKYGTKFCRLVNKGEYCECDVYLYYNDGKLRVKKIVEEPYSYDEFGNQKRVKKRREYDTEVTLKHPNGGGWVMDRLKGLDTVVKLI